MVDKKKPDLESGGEKRGGSSSKVVPEVDATTSSSSSSKPPAEEKGSSTSTSTSTSAVAPPRYPQPRLSVDLSSTLNQHALPATLRGDDSDDGGDEAAGTGTATKAKKPIRKLKAFRRHLLHPRTKRQKAVCGIFWIVLVVAAVCFLIWGLPPLTKKVLVPILERVKTTMSRPAIAGVIGSLFFVFFPGVKPGKKKKKLDPYLSLSLFPPPTPTPPEKTTKAMSFFAIMLLPIVFIPFRPFIWICSYAIGAGPAFGIVTLATTLGMTIQFFLSKTLLRAKATEWSRKATWSSTLMETVKEAGPFKTVLLLRLGPVPYSLLSYCLALSPEISYLKFIVASVIGHAPDNALHVFVGASLESVGSLVKGEKPKPQKIASVAVPLAAAIAVCIGGTIYGRRAYAKVRAARAEHAAEEAAEEALSGSAAGAAGATVAAGASVGAPASVAAVASNGTPPEASASGDVEMAIKK